MSEKSIYFTCKTIECVAQIKKENWKSTTFKRQDFFFAHKLIQWKHKLLWWQLCTLETLWNCWEKLESRKSLFTPQLMKKVTSFMFFKGTISKEYFSKRKLERKIYSWNMPASTQKLKLMKQMWRDYMDGPRAKKILWLCTIWFAKCGYAYEYYVVQVSTAGDQFFILSVKDNASCREKRENSPFRTFMLKSPFPISVWSFHKSILVIVPVM